MNPRFPVFIPTKGRWESRLTIKMFQKIGVPFTIFVEEPEFEKYSQYVGRDQIHILPHKDKGVTTTRNYIWDYAEKIGCDYYWTFDDNIDGLYRLNNNIKTPCADATILYAIEDFVLRYNNLVIAGPNYFMFVKRKYIVPPYILNTRIYSAMLIKTKIKDSNSNHMRWNTFFNEDTDLCLRCLKSGYCTVLFNAFLIYKQTTMTMKGGNTDYYDKTDKRLEFVKELQSAHSDMVKLTQKWGRWHHHIDYTKFKQQLIRKQNVIIPDVINNFGMVLQERINDKWTNADNLPASH